MAKWTIVAYPYEEDFLPRKQSKIIEAKNHDEAMKIAWREFPEYEEVGAYRIEN